MKYRNVALNENDYLKLKKISDKKNIPLTKILSLLIAYLEKNESIFFPELFSDLEKEEGGSVSEVLSQKDIQKIITKDINRIIGFIKRQDEELVRIKKEINDRAIQILYKLIPKDELELMEYHPLFNDYDSIIEILKKYMQKKGVNTENLGEDIKKELGENVFEEYIKYSDNIVKKNFLE